MRRRIVVHWEEVDIRIVGIKVLIVEGGIIIYVSHLIPRGAVNLWKRFILLTKSLSYGLHCCFKESPEEIPHGGETPVFLVLHVVSAPGSLP